MYKQDNVLITGASGFVGQSLLKRLDADPGYISTPVFRKPDMQLDRSALIISELSARTDWENGLQGIDVVVHLAARVHVMNEHELDPQEAYNSVNVEATEHLARQAAAAGVRRFIFISSVKVNGESTEYGCPFRHDDMVSPDDHYAVSKYLAEKKLLEVGEDTGMQVVILRPPLVYGPGVKGNFIRLVKAVLNERWLPFGAINRNKRSMVYIDNLVDLIVLCVRHPKAASHVFMVADEQALSTSTLIRSMAGSAGVQRRLVSVPGFILRALFLVSGKKALITRLLDSLEVDISYTKSVLGWVPPVSVQEGIKRTMSYYARKVGSTYD